MDCEYHPGETILYVFGQRANKAAFTICNLSMHKKASFRLRWPEELGGMVFCWTTQLGFPCEGLNDPESYRVGEFDFPGSQHLRFFMQSFDAFQTATGVKAELEC